MTMLTLEAADRLRRVAGPVLDGDRVKTRIARAARACGLTYWRAFDIWYRKAARIDAREIEAIRAAELARVQERHDDLARLAEDLDDLARRASAMVPGVGGQEAERLRELARRSRSLAEGDDAR